MVPYPHQAFQDVSYRAVMTGWLRWKSLGSSYPCRSLHGILERRGTAAAWGCLAGSLRWDGPKPVLPRWCGRRSPSENFLAVQCGPGACLWTAGAGQCNVEGS